MMERRIRVRRRSYVETPPPMRAPDIREPVLEANETSIDSQRFRLLKCSFCGESQLKRMHRNFWQKWISLFLSVFPYRCRRCAEEQARLIPSPRLVVPVLIILTVASVYVITLRNYRADLKARREAALRPRVAKGLTQLAAARMISTGRINPAVVKFSAAERARVLRNADIVELLRTTPDRRDVLQRIIVTKAAFDLSGPAVAQLKKAGVDEGVLSLMNLRMAQVAATGGDWLK